MVHTAKNGDREDWRLRLRDEIQRITQLPSVKMCQVTGLDVAVKISVGPDGKVTTGGTVSCGSVWSCPRCAAVVRSQRADKLGARSLVWLEDGHGVYMLTLTAQHWANVRLEDRIAAGSPCARKSECECGQACPVQMGQLSQLMEAWHGIAQGAWWVGQMVTRDKAPVLWSERHKWADDPKFPTSDEMMPKEVKGQVVVWRKGFRDRHGIAGTTRTVEITDGKNGWHSHIHALLWTDEAATRAAADELEQELFERWVKRCKAVGLPKPARGQNGKGGAVRVDPADRSKAGAQTLARYLAKVQEAQEDDTVVSRDLASEMTRGDLKSARGSKGRVPFQIAQDAAGGDRRSLLRWREYERATKGRRCLTWSHGLEKMLDDMLGIDPDDRTDEELANAEEETAAQAQDVYVAMGAYSQKVARRPGGRADIRLAGPAGGLPGVTALLDAWGLVQGTDYWLSSHFGENVRTTLRTLKMGADRAQAHTARLAAADMIPASRTPAEWAEAAQLRQSVLEAEAARAEGRDPLAEQAQRRTAHAKFAAELKKARDVEATQAALDRVRQSAGWDVTV
ncbi:hypothetical protein ACFU3J_27750 [Streptomyces sp. NPDC057411]|uniref:hypothetical protein n=1 Tax=unclassified Streptomyces TaxID=2593676 RepID=UPI003629BB09